MILKKFYGTIWYEMLFCTWLLWLKMIHGIQSIQLVDLRITTATNICGFKRKIFLLSLVLFHKFMLYKDLRCACACIWKAELLNRFQPVYFFGDEIETYSSEFIYFWWMWYYLRHRNDSMKSKDRERERKLGIYFEPTHIL